MTDSPDAIPLVSIIIPCRNEAAWIEKCLESVAANDFPKEKLEVFVLDGMSDDGTRPIIERIATRYPYVRLIDNPRKIVPVALNLGIAASRGSIVMRLDAHYEYPPHYITRLVQWLNESGADAVGGRLILEPANDSVMARTIAAAVLHPFGIGNAHYRIGTTKPRWVDAVLFGCYHREVFERIGLFDEEMVRNQDIELNRRLFRQGGKLLLAPDVVLHGCARDTLGKLARMYYQYAYFNPAVIHKTGGRVTLRQIVTPTFALSLMIAGGLSPWFWQARWLLAAILAAYAVPLTITAATTAVRHGWRCGLTMFAVLPSLHLSHGLGFLKGALDFFILRRRMTAAKSESISITR